MLGGFEMPSPGVTRARLIQERLRGSGASGGALPVLVATGKTGSGKSTLGNLLVGSDDVLRSDGTADCTDAVHVLRFGTGLTYVDLPGVASDEEFENVNRVAVGLPQAECWPVVDKVRVYRYDPPNLVGEQTHAVTEFGSGLLGADLLLYLVAPHRQIDRNERGYLRDLIGRHGPRRVVYVLNLFRDRAGALVSTAAHLQEVRTILTGLHAELGHPAESVRVVEMDCRVGTGLADLLGILHEFLGEPLAELLRYQRRVLPTAYLPQLTAALLRFGAGIARVVPTSDQEVHSALLAGANALVHGLRAIGADVFIDSATSKRFREVRHAVLAAVRHEHRRPRLEQRSRPRYRSEPIKDTVWEEDRSRPIYESFQRKVRRSPSDLEDVFDAFSNMLSGDGFTTYGWKTEQRVVGYEKRKSKIIVGYREVRDGEDTWTEQVGEELIGVTYDELGLPGIAAFLTAWLMITQIASSGQPAVDAQSVYHQCLCRLREAAPGDRGLSEQDLAGLLTPACEDLLHERTGRQIAGLLT